MDIRWIAIAAALPLAACASTEPTFVVPLDCQHQLSSQPARYLERPSSDEFSVATAGAGRIAVSNLAAKKVRAATGGAGSITLEGTSDLAQFAVGGAGSIEGKRLRTAMADIATSVIGIQGDPARFEIGGPEVVLGPRSDEALAALIGGCHALPAQQALHYEIRTPEQALTAGLLQRWPNYSVLSVAGPGLSIHLEHSKG